MKKFFLALVAMFAITAVASAANYEANDAAIDAAIENAVEVNAFNFGDNATPLGAAYTALGNNDIVAVLLTWLLGPFGIHRIYMGSTSLTWLWYTLLSFIGVGVVLAVIDLVFEIIGVADGSGLGKYNDNPNLIMWL